MAASSHLPTGPNTLPPSAVNWLGTVSHFSPSSGATEQAARSYSGHAWEAAPRSESSALVALLDLQGCSDATEPCAVTIPASTGGGYYNLTWRQTAAPSSEELAARFLMHASFGPSRASLRDLSSAGATSASTDAALAAWVTQQAALPASLHRAFFRARASPRLQATLGTGGVRQPCQNLSRWHRYTVSTEDEGRVLAFSQGEDGSTTLQVDGATRTVTTEPITLLDQSGQGAATPSAHHSYYICSVEEKVGGAVVVSNLTSGRRRLHVRGGSRRLEDFDPLGATANLNCDLSFLNPAIDMTSEPEMVHDIQPGAAQMQGLQTNPDASLLISASVPPPCSAAFVSHEGTHYRHDPRLRTLQNTDQSPTTFAEAATSYPAACPTVVKTRFNQHGCVFADTCAATAYTSVIFTLDAAAVQQFYDVGGKYVYYIEGLRLEDEDEVRRPNLNPSTRPTPTPTQPYI